MEQFNYTTKKKEYKHILRDDRYVIEQMLNAGKKMSDIIDVIGCSEKTLKREIKRGTWEYLMEALMKLNLNIRGMWHNESTMKMQTA